MNFQKWTTEQIIFLYQNYGLYGDTELAEMFNERWVKPYGWTKKHIEKKRMHMGMKRTPKQILAIKKRNGQQGRYNPVKSWDTRGRMKSGEVRAWNTTGGVRLHIKIKDRTEPYAHWLYEQIYGKVPDTHVVRLKDGDPFNVTPANLMLVTRREHGAINSKNRSIPIEIKEAIKANNNLKKIIYEQADN